MKNKILRCIFGVCFGAIAAECILIGVGIWIADAIFENIVPFTLIFVPAITVIITAATFVVSKKAADHITKPVELIITGSCEDEGCNVYPEFKPLVDRLHSQDKEISRQLARVEKEKNRLTAIINNMDEGLIILDNDLNVIMLNESAYSWMGTSIPRAECTGKTFSDVCISREICECVERADSISLDLDGRHLQLHVNHVVSNGEQVGSIGMLLDVTERTEIDRIKQEFTANVSHELKTPLTSISGYAELIESGMAKDDDATVFAGRIRKESTRMLALISDILKLSKLDEASDGVNSESVDLLKIARECRDLLEMSAERHEVTIKVDGISAYVPGSPGELSELVYNLIDNGIRYNRRGGEVHITVGNCGDNNDSLFASITVSDTGIGISKEHQPRVFERFYRVDKSRSKETGGTGLGLAIVKHVAERHNAKIELDSREGEGTSIRVLFYR